MFGIIFGNTSVQFPWILCDYTSDTLNLDDEKVYRDLSRPLGVVNPKNEEQVKEK